MGEVYRARDTRLGRDVAIKVLPAHLSSDSALNARFEREAKAISALNHPNICTLHDVGSQDSIGYLVMEFLEGQSLAERLQKGPLPLDQTLKIGREIADALDKAHRNAIIHRDLKPGNIMLTKSGAKLLDFGLARSASPEATLATMTGTAPQQSPITQQGTIVGTFQYMSPEQIEGKDLDGRSDIFSLGSVLYEMLTGQRAFLGKSQLSVASAILEKEPAPVASIKPLTPPSLEHTIIRCLAKNPDDRWQSAADIKHEFDWIAQSSSAAAAAISARPKRPSFTNFLIAALAIAMVAAAFLAGYLGFGRHRENSAPSIRATLASPPNVTVLTLGDEAGAPALSHDGTRLVFTGLAGTKQMLFVRDLDDITARPLPGTEAGKFPFWSPDDKSIGFFTEQQLKRVDLAGGPPLALATTGDGRGGSWGSNTIIFAPYIYSAILSIPATGGKAVPVTALDPARHTTHRWPHFLPDGKHFLYFAGHHMSGREDSSEIYMASLDGTTNKLVLKSNGSAFYSSGYLFTFRDGSLMAQPFDLGRLELTGSATPIGEVLRESGNWGVIASASDNGLLLYQSPGEIKYPIVWYDRSGKNLGPAPMTGQQLQDIRFSPDGTRIAYVSFDGASGNVYVSDAKTGARTRLSYEGSAWFTAWSPDGTKLAYSTQASGANETQISVKRTDGGGDPEILLKSGQFDHPSDWTRDGRYLIFNRGQIGSQHVWILPLFGDRKPFALFPNATYDHADGRVSPDGKWICYYSAESGRSEVYVTSFPSGVGRWQVSTASMIPPPIWRNDGKELFFVALDGNIMSATIHENPNSITVEKVQPLLRSPFVAGVLHTIYDVDPKGGQRLIGAAAPDTTNLPLNIVTNWSATLKGK